VSRESKSISSEGTASYQTLIHGGEGSSSQNSGYGEGEREGLRVEGDQGGARSTNLDGHWRRVSSFVKSVEKKPRNIYREGRTFLCHIDPEI